MNEKMTNTNKIACVSDVSIGYGSPQINKLVESLCEYYELDGIIIEPDDPQKPVKKDISKNCTIRRISTLSHPYEPRGRAEFTSKASKLVEQIKPDVLVICTTYSLPVLFKLSFRPRFIIYYYIETAMVYGDKDTEMNRKIGSLVDLIIFTEENRAIRFGEVCGFQNIPFCIVYNCVNESTCNIVPPNQRNDKIIYQGTIRKDTAADYYFDHRIQSFPIDIYGNIDVKEKPIFEPLLNTLQEDVKYKGYLNSQELSELRKSYLYSIVMWLPVNENNQYASPNKLFESIASGLPPITSPNPQCKLICKRYDCGIVMSDWSIDSFYESLRLAFYFRDTNQYERMVQNCNRAIQEELNWDTQMKKVKPLLK